VKEFHGEIQSENTALGFIRVRILSFLMLLDIRNRSRLLTGPQAWQVSPSVTSGFEDEDEHADMFKINVEYP